MSTKYRNSMDRSVAFSILLEVDSGFANSPVDDGSYLSGFLNDWYASADTDMYAFAQQWVGGYSVTKYIWTGET